MSFESRDRPQGTWGDRSEYDRTLALDHFEVLGIDPEVSVVWVRTVGIRGVWGNTLVVAKPLASNLRPFLTSSVWEQVESESYPIVGTDEFSFDLPSESDILLVQFEPREVTEENPLAGEVVRLAVYYDDVSREWKWISWTVPPEDHSAPSITTLYLAVDPVSGHLYPTTDVTPIVFRQDANGRLHASDDPAEPVAPMVLFNEGRVRIYDPPPS